jgi:hypothetical protein
VAGRGGGAGRLRGPRRAGCRPPACLPADAPATRRARSAPRRRSLGVAACRGRATRRAAQPCRARCAAEAEPCCFWEASKQSRRHAGGKLASWQLRHAVSWTGRRRAGRHSRGAPHGARASSSSRSCLKSRVACAPPAATWCRTLPSLRLDHLGAACLNRWSRRVRSTLSPARACCTTTPPVITPRQKTNYWPPPTLTVRRWIAAILRETTLTGASLATFSFSSSA